MMNLAFQVVGQIQSQQQATLKAVEASQKQIEAASTQNAETIRSLRARLAVAIAVGMFMIGGMVTLLLYVRAVLRSVQHRTPPARPPPAAPHAKNGMAARLTSLLAAGQSLLDLKQPARALICFEEVLTLDPRNAKAHIKKGAALEQLGQCNEAIASYDRAITLDPLLSDAYVAKGGIFNRLERYQEALNCYEQAALLQPSLTLPPVPSLH